MRGNSPDWHTPILVLLERHPWILTYVWELGVLWVLIGTPLVYLVYSAL